MSASARFLCKYGASLRRYEPAEKDVYVSETKGMDAEKLNEWVKKYRFRKDNETKWVTLDMVRAMYKIKYGDIPFRNMHPLLDNEWYYKTIISWITKEKWGISNDCRKVAWEGLDQSYAEARLFFIANERKELASWMEKLSTTGVDNKDVSETYRRFFTIVPDCTMEELTDWGKEMLLQEKRKERSVNITNKTVARKGFDTIDAEEDDSLRTYQQQAIRDTLDAWGSYRNVMLQMPTGTGKTRLFVSLINSIGHARFLIVTHREELVEQISETLKEHYHLEHGILQGRNTRYLDKHIIVASIQSLSVYSKPLWEGYRGEVYLIIDEAHHSIAKTYTELWERFPQAYKLGVTATPYRLGRGTFCGHYQFLIQSKPMAFFIRNGFLSDYTMYMVSSQMAEVNRLNGLTRRNAAGDYMTTDLQGILAQEDAIAFLYHCYKEHCMGKRGIIYAVNRAHGEMIETFFKERGVDIGYIDSRTASKKRKEITEGFCNGSPQVLVNVEIFGEGFDCPDMDFAMLARPTRSLAMYLQQVGRALRRKKGDLDKEPAIILDCVGLYNRFGLPEEDRRWERFFNGNKTSEETFDRPLGTEGERTALIEVKRGKTYPYPFLDKPCMTNDKGENITAKERVVAYEVFEKNGLMGIRRHNGMVSIKPEYKQLEMTEDGWFHGKTTKNELVIIDGGGRLVFRIADAEIKVRHDGTFKIIVNAPKGQTVALGPFNKHMYIIGENVRESSIGGMTVFIQKEPRLAMMDRKLTMENGFYKNAFIVRGKANKVFLLDLFDRVFEIPLNWEERKEITPTQMKKEELLRKTNIRLFHQ